MLAIGTTVSAEAAPVREPLERVAHAGAVDHAGADAADCGPDVEQQERTRDRVDGPSDRHQHVASEAMGRASAASDVVAISVPLAFYGYRGAGPAWHTIYSEWDGCLVRGHGLRRRAHGVSGGGCLATGWARANRGKTLSK